MLVKINNDQTWIEYSSDSELLPLIERGIHTGEVGWGVTFPPVKIKRWVSINVKSVSKFLPNSDWSYIHGRESKKELRKPEQEQDLCFFRTRLQFQDVI